LELELKSLLFNLQGIGCCIFFQGCRDTPLLNLFLLPADFGLGRMGQSLDSFKISFQFGQCLISITVVVVIGLFSLSYY
jgi:hypothetical protein